MARNAIFLYLRMFLLMLIGLFTSRVVLRELGVDDYGIWNAVGGAVSVFTFVTASVSSAISRFLAFEIGRSDMDRLKRVFATGLTVQILLTLLLVVLVESAGMWFLNNYMVIPEGRIAAARTVLHCSLGVLAINMLSVPYNASIIAHERMSAFAYISIGEAALKLLIAMLLSLSVFDKLETFALLMLLVALLVRMAYGFYCRRHFAECHSRPSLDCPLLKEMLGFAGWSFLGSGTNVLNIQGAGLIVNLFFGVAANAARGVAAQVEGMVKQFAFNFLTALNPQITKSWAAGNRDYCFSIVTKGVKYSYLAVLVFLVPIMFEAETLLGLWLGNVPEGAACFVRLTMLVLLVDVSGNALLTLQLATGKVARYYMVTGLVSLLCLPGAWLAFSLGGAAHWAYISALAVYIVVFALRLVFASRATGFPVWDFLRNMVSRLLLLSVLSLVLPALAYMLMPDGVLRLILVCLLAWPSIAVLAIVLVLTDGEREFLLRKFGRYLPDGLFLRFRYRLIFGRKANLRHPQRYTEKLQWQKLYDHNPLYHTLVDKAEVKTYVAAAIGEKHVIPTIGVWDSPDEIPWDDLPRSFVLKCTHDSGSTIVCRDISRFDREAACRKLRAACSANYYRKTREWAYKGVRPRIIAEECVEGPVNDYKFFCFNGKPELMFVATDRFSVEEETKFDFFDMEYRHLDIRNGHPNAAAVPERPASFEEMKELAARLSAGMPQVRVDFYQAGDRVLFGEFTFYHWGGFVPFEPDEADIQIGELFDLPGRS